MKRNYQIINICLISIFLLGGIYFLLIFLDIVEGTKCYYQQTYGQPCPTCGLTRSFVKIIEQKSFDNIPTNFRVYFIYLNYLIWSRFVFYFIGKGTKEIKPIVVTDVGITVISTILFFIFVFL